MAMGFVADTADFPAICYVSDAKDITRNRRETSLRYKQFGKGIVKYNAFKQNFTLFCSTSEPKGVSFTLLIFRWKIFDRHNVLYASENEKVGMISHLKLQMCLTGLKRSLTCFAGN